MGGRLAPARSILQETARCRIPPPFRKASPLPAGQKHPALIVKRFSADASNQTVGLLAAIPQLVTVVAMIVWGRRSDRRQERRWHLALPMLAAAAGWMLTAMSAGSYTAMSIFRTTPDQALSPEARVLGIAVINAIGNIGPALNPLVVGWLRDTAHSFTSGLLYAAALMATGVLSVFLLPLDRGRRGLIERR